MYRVAVSKFVSASHNSLGREQVRPNQWRVGIALIGDGPRPKDQVLNCINNPGEGCEHFEECSEVYELHRLATGLFSSLIEPMEVW